MTEESSKFLQYFAAMAGKFKKFTTFWHPRTYMKSDFIDEQIEEYLVADWHLRKD